MKVTSLYESPKVLQINGSYKTVFNWRWYQVLRAFNPPLLASYGDDIYKKIFVYTKFRNTK